MAPLLSGNARLLDDVFDLEAKMSVCISTLPPFPYWCLDHYPNPWSLAVVSSAAIIVIVVALIALIAVIAIVAIRLLCL